MSHALDITDGQVSFVSAREDAWHQLGQVVPEAMTAQQALEFGHLAGWNVRKLPAWATDEEGNAIEMTDRFASVRTNPINGKTEFLGDVGKVYTTIQNEAHVNLLDALVDESGGHFETVGALDGGRRVFVTMKVPAHILIGGVDKVDCYLAAINSHDGSTPFTFMTTPIRIVCANTLNLAFHNCSNVFKIRHTTNSEKAVVAQAREVMGMTFDYIEGFQEQAEMLINTTVTQRRFEEIISAEFGAPEDAAKKTVTMADKRIETLAELFADAGTQEGIRHTAWAGFNALTEYADHFAAARGDERELRLARRAINEPSFKQPALDLMMREVVTL